MASAVDDVVWLREEALRGYCQRLLEGEGVGGAHAALVADSLVAANLRGVDSHGVLLLPGYLAQLRNGGVDGSAQGRVVAGTGGVLLYDGANGLGQVVSAVCCDHAVRLARSQGVALVVARNSHHYGAAAYWSQRIAAGGCIGLALSTAGPAVAPWQGRTPSIGTNPIAMALPGEAGRKWLLDMATSTVAKNKVANAASLGWATIPATWGFVDAAGSPTTDCKAAEQGWPLPLGGYKGTGLAMMIELLCAGLSGGPVASDVPTSRDGSEPLKVSHTFVAIEVSAFTGLDEFGARTGRLVDIMKNAELRPGFDEVLVAGEPEWRTEAERRVRGIPVARALWQQLCGLGAQSKIPPPIPDVST